MSSPLAAQLPDWATTSATANAIVSLEQSWCAVRDGNVVKVFSCMNRRWATLQTVAAPDVRILNDAFIVRDGNVFYGYSPRTGRFAAQFTWSPTATLAAQPTPQTWLGVVSDRNAIHVFQAIDGVWTTYPLAGPPTVTMGTFCAVIDDGQAVYGVSAFYGTPVRLADASGPATVQGAFGNAGIAASTNLVHGFSAYRNTWATTAASPAATFRSGNTQAAFVAIEEPSKVTFFSGHTGTFTSIATNAPPVVELERAVAVVDDFPDVYGYSALTGTTARIVVASPPAIARQQWFMLVEDSAGISAFSAHHGAFTAPIAGTLLDVTTRSETAVWQPAGNPVPLLVYSQYRNDWLPLPSLPNGLAGYHQTAASVVLVDPTGGLYGLSIRGSAWIHQPTPPIDSVYVGTSRPSMEMTIVARSGLDLWAFNSRIQAWRHTTTRAPATTFHGNNTALIVQDGSHAYGYSSWTDRWSSQPLGSAVVSASAQVQSAYVRVADAVHAYSGVGQLATSLDYPEYWRAPTRGGRLRLDIAGEPGSLAVLLVGLGATELPLPGIGTLRVDPALSFVMATAVLPEDGLSGVVLQVPSDPSLAGFGLHFQSAITSGSSIYLTNAVDHTIL